MNPEEVWSMICVDLVLCSVPISFARESDLRTPTCGALHSTLLLRKYMQLLMYIYIYIYYTATCSLWAHRVATLLLRSVLCLVVSQRCELQDMPIHHGFPNHPPPYHPLMFLLNQAYSRLIKRESKGVV